jgi:hypothetical protein
MRVIAGVLVRVIGLGIAGAVLTGLVLCVARSLLLEITERKRDDDGHRS